MLVWTSLHVQGQHQRNYNLCNATEVACSICCTRTPCPAALAAACSYGVGAAGMTTIESFIDGIHDLGFYHKDTMKAAVEDA